MRKSSKFILLSAMVFVFCFTASSALATVTPKSISMDIDGIPTVNQAITFTVEAEADCDGPLYYYFSYIAGHGTSSYDTNPWINMRDVVWSTDNSVTHAFSEAGTYVVVAWVSATESAPSPLPLIGTTVTVGGGSGDTYTNSLGMTFNLIPAGTFTMGSPTNELGRDSDETQHQVTLTQSYYMQTTEVTQGQWRSVMGSNPSYFSSCGDNCPVELVSWDDIQSFLTAMNQRGEGSYRLPTEAEWEYAARAGSTTAFANGGISVLYCDYDPNLNAMGWYCYNASDTTHPVAQKQANAWGLYDMHGNVWEWCQDRYGSYPTSVVTDPTGPTSGSNRVLRGGSWGSIAGYCRSANRGGNIPDIRSDDFGFRLVALPGQ